MNNTKNELRAIIDTKLINDERIPLSIHRGVLKDDSINLLDNIYSIYDVDTQDNEDFWTLLSPLSMNYTIHYSKQGRKVLINGILNNVNEPRSNISSFNLSKFAPSFGTLTPNSFGIGYILRADLSVDIATIFVTPDNNGKLFMKPAILIGDTCYFSITYFTQQ